MTNTSQARHYAAVPSRFPDTGKIDPRAWTLTDVTVENYNLNYKVRRKNERTGMFSAGLVTLRNVSPFLRNSSFPGLIDIPPEAKAELLVAPQDIREIKRRGTPTGLLLSYQRATQEIREVRGYFGLDGMFIHNDISQPPERSYEESLALKLRMAFAAAQLGGKPIVTGLFMPTVEISRGYNPLRNADSTDPLETSLAKVQRDLLSGADEGVKDPGFQPLITTPVTDEWATKKFPDFLWTCTAHPKNPESVAVMSSKGEVSCLLTDKHNECLLSARPVALVIQPTGFGL